MSPSSSPPPGSLPVWMAQTLLSTGDGFFFADGIERPPANDTTPAQEAYPSLARSLMQLRQGDFNVGSQVLDVLLANDDQDIWFMGSYLLGYGVPHAQLRSIGQCLMDSETHDSTAQDFVRERVCVIQARSMMLSAVPHVVQLYRSTETRDLANLILIELADLFEPTPGELFDAIGTLSDEDESVASYLQTLMEHYSRAEKRAADAGTHLFYRGAPFVFPEYARSLLKRIAANDPRENFANDRMLFEANTGIRCSRFFDSNGHFVPLAAAAIVEEFLDSDEVVRFRPGVRYFFGHPIPD